MFASGTLSRLVMGALVALAIGIVLLSTSAFAAAQI